MIKSMNRISVIIPTFQHASTIARCLESVLAQTLQPSEIIVVDDGSTDNTAEILKPYEGRVKIMHQFNQGANTTRNAGFAVSHGERVIFCDADAVLRPIMLERLSAALDRNIEASYAYSGFKFGWKKFRSFSFNPMKLRNMNHIHTSALIRREHFPGFDPAIHRLQDWDLWLTMLEQGHTGVWVDEELFRIVDAHGRKGISQWRPTLWYTIPWQRLGWRPSSIRKFDEARETILAKHGIFVSNPSPPTPHLH